MEKTFQQKDKKFAVISHQVYSLKEEDFGKVILQYHDRPDAEEPVAAEKISGLRLLENGYSIIYKICGFLDLFNDETVESAGDQSGRTDSLMILENDFFAFSRQLERLIPDYITRQFPGKGL